MSDQEHTLGDSSTSNRVADRFICEVLWGSPAPWPNLHKDTKFAQDFLQRCEFHGVAVLLHELLSVSPTLLTKWPAGVIDSLRATAIAQAMWELRHQVLLRSVLTQLARAGVQPVLFKGTALAHSLYSQSALRIRGDTDFIIPPGTFGSLDQTLVAAGFERGVAVSGEHISYQATYIWVYSQGQPQALDVHWRINNSEVLSRLFTYSELCAAARPLLALGPDAIAAGHVHALLLACMHRATHKQNPYYVDGVAYYDGDRLIWLYDIHLLLGVLTPAEVDEFVRLAGAKGLRAVCLEGIERAQACFHTAVPPGLLTELAAPGPVEPPGRYLSGGPWLQKWMDFQALGSTRNRMRYVRELLFPPADYMRHKYPNAGSGGLGWLYIRRAAGGVFKMLRGHADAHS